MQVGEGADVEISAACTDGKDMIVLGDSTNTLSVWRLRLKRSINASTKDSLVRLDIPLHEHACALRSAARSDAAAGTKRIPEDFSPLHICHNVLCAVSNAPTSL